MKEVASAAFFFVVFFNCEFCCINTCDAGTGKNSGCLDKSLESFKF